MENSSRGSVKSKTKSGSAKATLATGLEQYASPRAACAVRVVGSAELQRQALVAPHAQRVGRAALVLQVVTVEAQSTVTLLVQELRQVPAVHAGLRVTGRERHAAAGRGRDHGGPLGTTEVRLHGGRVPLIPLKAVESDLRRDVLDNFHVGYT